MFESEKRCLEICGLIKEDSELDNHDKILYSLLYLVKNRFPLKKINNYFVENGDEEEFFRQFKLAEDSGMIRNVIDSDEFLERQYIYTPDSLPQVNGKLLIYEKMVD